MVGTNGTESKYHEVKIPLPFQGMLGHMQNVMTGIRELLNYGEGYVIEYRLGQIGGRWFCSFLS